MNEMKLVNTVAEVPEPDMLIAVKGGAVHTDVLKLKADEGTVKRGSLLGLPTAGGDYAVISVKDGDDNAYTKMSGFAVLAEDVVFGETGTVEAPAYFEGDFTESKVIFAGLDEDGDRAEALEKLREPLRKCKIFLRAVH